MPVCLAGLGALAACTAPIATPAVAPQTLAPQALIGATPQVLTAEFGQPDLLRVDGPAQVWLYHSASCGLNLILYPDTAGVPRVALATAADGGSAIGDCAAGLQQSHIETELNEPALPAPAATALEPPRSS